MSASDIIAVIAVVISAVSAVAAIFSVAIARQTLKTNELLARNALNLGQDALKMNEKIFKREGVIDLHIAWNGVQPIDSANPNAPAIIRAVNALDLTASLWNHDIVEKVILYQSYWEPFRQIYDTLNNMNNTVIPGTTKTGQSFLTREMARAYNGMHQADIEAVQQSAVSSSS